MKKKYELIIEHIENLAAQNLIKQGERLPSIRNLSLKFDCNKSTVIRAYDELEMKHLIYSIQRGGYYLVDKYIPGSSNPGGMDFSAVEPDPALLPYNEFSHCINRAVELYKNNMFLYCDTQGLESLRRELVHNLREHQVYTDKENIFITSGAQQALDILTKMPFPNRKGSILAEQPTYSLMHSLAELNNKRLLGISRDFKGIDFNELERIFKGEDIKFFYTIPRLHNPLGTSYTEKQKRRIVELAAKYDVYIVEDDYLADIDPDQKALPEHFYDTAGRVVYVKSFSKSFMPGIRIGAVVLCERLKEEFLKYKRCCDLNTSVLAQGALEIFLSSGMYKKHIRKAQLRYRKKMDCLKGCLQSMDVEGAELFMPKTGFFAWIKLPQSLDINNLTERLKKKKIYISPSDSFFIGHSPVENAFRICISQLPEDKIRTGIRAIFEEIRGMSCEI
jgi:DNA-binding transcriptional MocR family regulator